MWQTITRNPRWWLIASLICIAVGWLSGYLKWLPESLWLTISVVGFIGLTLVSRVFGWRIVAALSGCVAGLGFVLWLWPEMPWWVVITGSSATGFIVSAIFAIREENRSKKSLQSLRFAKKEQSEMQEGNRDSKRWVGAEKKTESHELLKTAISNFPQQWNEGEIKLAIERYRGSNLLTEFIGHVFTRFIVGQEEATAARRMKFLEQFNQYAAVARESYKWQRVLARGGRAKIEEDLSDLRVQVDLTKAQADLARAKGELEQIGLENQVKHREKEFEIAQIEKGIRDLKKRDKKPREKSAEDIRKENQERVETEITKREQELKSVRANPDLSEDSKRRRENNISRKLDALHEELDEYL